VFIGGRYCSQLGGEWDGVIDLTGEFPETCKTREYLCIPLWDGNAPTPADLEACASFFDRVHKGRRGTRILVHCAHGRGRSCAALCACAVRADMAATWQNAFKMIWLKRPVVTLNHPMMHALQAWQEEGNKQR
jgi:protein-tyrosine phosphatase